MTSEQLPQDARALQPDHEQNPIKRWAIALRGQTAHEFMRQVHDLQPSRSDR
jgi:hypothetical protein